MAREEVARINRITGMIIDAGIKVHSTLGPGLMEHVYETCLAHELRKRGLKVETQVPVGLHYDGLTFDVGFRIDMLVEDEVVVELKTVSTLLAVHESQALSYVKLADKRIGLLINFHVAVLKDGIRRIVNGL